MKVIHIYATDCHYFHFPAPKLKSAVVEAMGEQTNGSKELNYWEFRNFLQEPVLYSHP